MTKWELLEEYLTDLYTASESRFTHAGVRDYFETDGRTASELIQSYLGAQVSKNTPTEFLIHRGEGRTRNAVWHVGYKAVDARSIGKQTIRDFGRRLDRAIEPSLRILGEKNPRALPAARAVLKSLEAGIELIAAMLDGDE